MACIPLHRLTSPETMQFLALHHRSLWSTAGLIGPDLSALLDTALSLKRAAAEGRPLQPLRGKNIAVMGGSPESSAAQDFTRAAQALGAQVAHLASETNAGASADTARLLGRLYDAIGCEGMPLAAVQALERSTGLPIFNGLGEATHPSRVLAEMLDQREPAPTGEQQDNRHYALQALLCCAVA